MSLKVNNDKLNKIINLLKDAMDKCNDIKNHISSFETTGISRTKTWPNDKSHVSYAMNFVSVDSSKYDFDNDPRAEYLYYVELKNAAIKYVKETMIPEGQKILTDFSTTAATKLSKYYSNLTNIRTALKNVKSYVSTFESTPPPNFDGIAETVKARSSERLGQLYKSSLTDSGGNSNYYSNLLYEELTGGKVSAKQLYLLTFGVPADTADSQDLWGKNGIKGSHMGGRNFDLYLRTGASLMDGKTENAYYSDPFLGRGVSLEAWNYNEKENNSDELINADNTRVFADYTLQMTREDESDNSKWFEGNSVTGAGGAAMTLGLKTLEAANDSSSNWNINTLPSNLQGNQNYRSLIDKFWGAEEEIAGSVLNPKTVADIGDRGVSVVKDLFYTGSSGSGSNSSNLRTADLKESPFFEGESDHNGRVLSQYQVNKEPKTGNDNGEFKVTSMKPSDGFAVKVKGDDDIVVAEIMTQKPSDGSSLKEAFEAANNNNIADDFVSKAKMSKTDFDGNKAIDLIKTEALKESAGEGVSMLTGKPSVENSTVVETTPEVSGVKEGMAASIGMIPSGPTAPVSGSVGGPVMGPDLSGITGINIPGISVPSVNVPNITITNITPSINAGGSTGIDIYGMDTASAYSNINFSTTPSLDTIQSPNQLMESLNSLPESVREKISSMDLDNRAESAYYNSMSNEEFDDIKNKQVTKFRSMTKEQIKERLKRQGYSDEESEIIANNENIGVVAFLVGEQNVTMEALRRAISNGEDEESDIKNPTIEELVSGEAAARLLNPYQDEEVKKAAEEYEYIKEKYNRAVSKSNASSKALKIANEKLRKTRIDIEQIDGKDINKWTKEHITKYNDCVKVFMEEKEVASKDLEESISVEKELQKALEVLKEAKDKFNKKMAGENALNDPAALLLIAEKEKKEKEEPKEEEKNNAPLIMISKKKVMPNLQMYNLDDVEVLTETGSLSTADKAIVEQNVSQSVDTYKDDQQLIENRPAENVPKEVTVGSMEINGKEIQIKKSANNFVEAPAEQQ